MHSCSFSYLSCMVRQLLSEVTERAKIKDMLKRKRLKKINSNYYFKHLHSGLGTTDPGGWYSPG